MASRGSPTSRRERPLSHTYRASAKKIKEVHGLAHSKSAQLLNSISAQRHGKRGTSAPGFGRRRPPPREQAYLKFRPGQKRRMPTSALSSRDHRVKPKTAWWSEPGIFGESIYGSETDLVHSDGDGGGGDDDEYESDTGSRKAANNDFRGYTHGIDVYAVKGGLWNSDDAVENEEKRGGTVPGFGGASISGEGYWSTTTNADRQAHVSSPPYSNISIGKYSRGRATSPIFSAAQVERLRSRPSTSDSLASLKKHLSELTTQVGRIELSRGGTATSSTAWPTGDSATSESSGAGMQRACVYLLSASLHLHIKTKLTMCLPPPLHRFTAPGTLPNPRKLQMNSLSSGGDSSLFKQSSMLSTVSSTGSGGRGDGRSSSNRRNVSAKTKVPFSKRRVDRFGFPKPHSYMLPDSSSNRKRGSMRDGTDEAEVRDCGDTKMCFC